MELNTKKLTLRPEEPAKFDGDIWTSAWKVLLKKDRTLLGRVWFDAPEKGNCRLHFEMEEGGVAAGYLTEALHTLLIWLFVQDGVKSVTAQGDAAAAALKANGFVLEDGVWKRVKTARAWFFLPIFMCVGMAVGTVYALLGHSFLLWVLIGLGGGSILGALLDQFIKVGKNKK